MLPNTLLTNESIEERELLSFRDKSFDNQYGVDIIVRLAGKRLTVWLEGISQFFMRRLSMQRTTKRIFGLCSSAKASTKKSVCDILGEINLKALFLTCLSQHRPRKK